MSCGFEATPASPLRKSEPANLPEHAKQALGTFFYFVCDPTSFWLNPGKVHVCMGVPRWFYQTSHVRGTSSIAASSWRTAWGAQAFPVATAQDVVETKAPEVELAQPDGSSV